METQNLKKGQNSYNMKSQKIRKTLFIFDKIGYNSNQIVNIGEENEKKVGILSNR